MQWLVWHDGVGFTVYLTKYGHLYWRALNISWYVIHTFIFFMMQLGSYISNVKIMIMSVSLAEHFFMSSHTMQKYGPYDFITYHEIAGNFEADYHEIARNFEAGIYAGYGFMDFSCRIREPLCKHALKWYCQTAMNKIPVVVDSHPQLPRATKVYLEWRSILHRLTKLPLCHNSICP